MAGGGGLVCVDVHVLSLLPRTLGSRYDAIVAPGKMSEEKELDAIRCFFKSMISCDRVELTAEAKDKATDPLYKCLKNNNLTKVLNQTDQMHGRRQALGRKRARFSFKPNVGQDRDPLLCVETKLSVDHIKDPEEFFSAVEKMEYAEKVLKKLRGEVENESIENLKWTPSRKCRPGILGRRASYKHHFSSQLESIEADSLSQCENQALSPLKATKNPTFIPILLPKIKSGASRAGEADDTHIYNASDLQGSETKEEKSVDHILSNLLYSFEDINEGDEIEFLEERLRIKSINMDKVCLPPLDRCLGNNLTLTDGKKTSHSSEISSSNATRSPLASIAALKRRILRKDTLEDPFHMEALSDSSSENSSLNEGSHRSSKTRIRLNNRRNSLASTIAMRTPTSNPLANDIASTTIKDNTRDKVNAILFEVDLPDQEMHLETSAGVVNTDSRRNSLASTIGIPDGMRTPARNPLANDIASTTIKDNARDKVNATLFEEVDLPDQEMHLETSVGVVNTDSRRNSLASTIGTRTPTSNPLANDIASTTIKGNTRDKVYAILFEEVDRPDQEMHLETSAGVVGTDNSKNGIFFEIGVLANNEVDDTLVEASLANKVDEADERSHLEETMACDRISFDNGTDGHSVETAAVANKKVFDVLETPASAGVSRSRRKRKLRSLTATQDDVTADVVCNPVETNYRGKVADETNQELHLRSIVSENRVLRNRSVDNGTGAISNTTNMVDFSSADESDDIHQEALITSEADCGNKESPLESANPKIPVDTALGNNVNGDSLEIVGPTMEKVNDVQENHASNNKGKGVESNSRSTIHKERPDSTIQPSLTTPRIISNRQIDGIELGASSVVVPSAIDFSSEDENNIVNEETLITSEAGASADEIPVNYSVKADSLEIGDATAGKASDVQGVHMSNSKDQSSADVATNIPTNGCSESSSVLDEHNTEVQDENQSNSTAALETEVPQKKQSKQKRTNRRQSLAGAGTAWQCGVRRSTRIRTKPLAHWRGERILYARIHDTLPTMIGMKYASPAKSDQKALPVLKVKSFVSEEYADLLQKVSLH